jgi:capsular exopolysaccharide synthesis family protein
MSDQTPVIRQSAYRDSGTFMPLGDLRAYVTVLRRRKWSVILVTALVVATAAFFSYRQTPMYRATATVQVKPLNPNQILQGYSYNFAVSMSTEQALLTSPAVADLAGTEATAQGVSLAGTSVSSSVPVDTTFLEVTCSAPAPTQAAVCANAYTAGYMQNRREQALQQYRGAQSGYEGKIAEVQAQLDDARAELKADPSQAAILKPEIDSLNKQIRTLQTQAAAVAFPVADTAAQLIAPATEPTAPYTPDWVRNLTLALLLGLALGVGVAFVRERLDDRMTGRADFETHLGAPVLSIVPAVKGWKKRNATLLVTRDRAKSGPSEAYRTVRTNIAFMAKSNNLQAIAMTSPGMGEGKTTSTANLAVALSQTGKRVIAIDCDLRKPRLHKFFELENDRGVTTLVAGEATVPEVARRVPGLETLRVIPSGKIPHNPAELLGSAEFDEMLELLRRYAEFVLIDTAPVLAVSDALVATPKADGTIVVVDAGNTTRSAVEATREQLEQVGTNIIGGIFNNFDPSKTKSYPGYYRYHYYGAEEYHDEAATPRRKQEQVDPAEFWS